MAGAVEVEASVAGNGAGVTCCAHSAAKGPGYASPLEAMCGPRETLIYVTCVYNGYMDRLPNSKCQPKEITKPKKSPSSSRLKRKSVKKEEDIGRKEDPGADDTMKESTIEEEIISPKILCQENLILKVDNKDDIEHNVALSPLDSLCDEIQVQVDCPMIQLSTSVDASVFGKETALIQVDTLLQEDCLLIQLPASADTLYVEHEVLVQEDCTIIQPPTSADIIDFEKEGPLIQVDIPLQKDCPMIQLLASAGASVSEKGGPLIQVDKIINFRYMNDLKARFTYLKKGFHRRRRRKKSYSQTKVMVRPRWRKRNRNSSRLDLYCERHNYRLRLSFEAYLVSTDKFRKLATFYLFWPKSRNASNYPKISLQDCDVQKSEPVFKVID